MVSKCFQLVLFTAIGLAQAQEVAAQSEKVAIIESAFDSRLQLADWDHDHVQNLLRISDTVTRRTEIEAAALANNLDALTLSGLARYFGVWGAEDKAKGWSQIEAAASKGHLRAMAIVGLSKWQGDLVAENKAEAQVWIQKAADAGSGLAQGNLGLMILDKNIEPRPGDYAVKLLEQAAAKGIVWASKALGEVYAAGQLAPKNDAKARNYFQQAARLGDIDGLATVGAMAWFGEREPLDSKFLGFAKLELAARNGQIDAMRIVSDSYIGVFPHLNLVDVPAAIKMLEAAKELTDSKDKTVNQLLSKAKSVFAQQQANKGGFGSFGVGYRPASGAAQKRELSSKEIVDSIQINFPVWPQGIPQPRLPAIKGDRSQVDEYGVSEREWREFPTSEFMIFAMLPSTLQKISTGYAKRDPKALTLISMAAHDWESKLDLESAYPQCFKSKDKPEYCNYLSTKLADYLTATGIGFSSSNRASVRSGDRYTAAIADYLIGKPSMRAQMEAQVKYGAYNDYQRSRLLAYADLGYLPAVQYLEQKSGACARMPEDAAFLARHGRNQRNLVEAALALGDSETAFQYGRQLRDALCVGRDPEGAQKLFRTAADLGNLKAKYELMNMYAGYGASNMSRKYREALRLAKDLELELGEPIHPPLMEQIRIGAAEETSKRAGIGDVTDDPTKPLNAATIRAVVLRELRVTMNRFSGISFMSLFGNPPYENWNYDDGSFLFETQNPNDMFGIYYRTDFYVSGASCSAISGVSLSYDCSYKMSASLDWRIGKSTLANIPPGPSKPQKHRFEFVDGQWRSASLRAEVMSNLPTNGIGATGAGNNNGLCKSLYAGVVAVGGKSTDKSLEPSTWGC